VCPLADAGERIKGRFYEPEIQQSDDERFDVDRRLKSRGGKFLSFRERERSISTLNSVWTN